MCHGLLPSLGKETPNPSPAETGKLSGAGHWPGARRWQRPCLACSGPRPRVPMSPASTPPRGLVRGAAEVLSMEWFVTTWLTSPRSTTQAWPGRGGKSMVVGLLTLVCTPTGKGTRACRAASGAEGSRPRSLGAHLLSCGGFLVDGIRCLSCHIACGEHR